MRELSDLDVVELVRMIKTLESDNAALRAALAKALCGNVLDKTTSCQLGRGHDGLHAWGAADSDMIIRWG